jgi:class 3 adenylate cyclase
VVTFLFTDVEGSTRRWECDAEAMRAALAEHDEVLRAAIEDYFGYLFSDCIRSWAARTGASRW